ncbi:putative endoglucanase type K [Fusarium sp. AF-6]|nr:putative endoglucanase type K [Fusarium sp. AF-6]
MRSSTLIALAGPLAVRAASGNGHSTRYWDCCKPSCSWADKAAVSAPALTCDKNDNPISDANAKSGCDGGSAFACTNYSPWAVNDNLAYGFAATKLSGGSEATWCCACYSLTFTTGPVKGKTMVVQSTNTGGDLGENHFDLQMPGGGVGIFDGCSSQFGGSGLGGAQYGGISARSDCDSFPELLKDGCYWRFDWFENADNPDFTFEQVQCPKALTDISGCTRDDDSSFPAFSGDTSSSGSSSGSSGSSSKASTSKAAVQTQKTQAPATEQKSTQVQQQPSNVQTQVQSSASQPQQTQAPVQEPATSKTTKATAKASATKSAAASAQSAVAAWYQCGGSKSAYPDGNLPCASGSTCVQHNEYYSQCVPN